MSKKDLWQYLVLFLLSMLFMAGVVYSQTPTPKTKGGITPTPTVMPERAPSAGLGGGR